MTVLHFIKNLDKNNLSGLFMNDLLKGGIDKTTTHILTMSVNDTRHRLSLIAENMECKGKLA